MKTVTVVEEISGVTSKLTKIIADSLFKEEALVVPEASLSHDLEADSLDVQNLILGIEDAFELKIEDNEIADIKTVGDVYELINKKLLKSIIKEKPQEDNLVHGGKTFTHHLIITLGRTNAERNVYFNELNGIMGEVRDLFALSFIPNFKEAIGVQYMLITAETHGYYKKNLYFADEIDVVVSIGKILPTSVILKFEFINSNTGELHTEGEHVIVFSDINGRPQPFPPEFKALLQQFVKQ